MVPTGHADSFNLIRKKVSPAWQVGGTYFVKLSIHFIILYIDIDAYAHHKLQNNIIFSFLFIFYTK